MSQTANLNLNCFWVRDPVAGVYFVISAPGSGCRPVPLWLGAFLWPNQMKSVSVRSWMIPAVSWMSSGGY